MAESEVEAEPDLSQHCDELVREQMQVSWTQAVDGLR